MFSELTRLVSVLSEIGALRNPKVVSALSELAQSLSDEDHRSHLLGELGVSLASLGETGQAERFARSVKSTERSEFLRRIAEIEGRGGLGKNAMQLLLEAREAAMSNRLPTQRAQALAEIAASLKIIGEQAQADETWNAAILLAREAQLRGGTDGPEAAGVLLSAVEAFCGEGRANEARSVAATIVFDGLRERALQIVDRTKQ